MAEVPQWVLLVEARDDLRRLLALLIQLAGFEVVTSSSNAQALKTLASLIVEPSVIVLDATDAEVTVRSAIRALGIGNFAHIPVIATSPLSPEDRRPASALAGVPFVTKDPLVSMSALVDAIRLAVMRRERGSGA